MRPTRQATSPLLQKATVETNPALHDCRRTLFRTLTPICPQFSTRLFKQTSHNTQGDGGGEDTVLSMASGNKNMTATRSVGCRRNRPLLISMVDL